MSRFTILRGGIMPSRKNLGIPGVDTSKPKSWILPALGFPGINPDEPKSFLMPFDSYKLADKGGTGGSHYASDTYATLVREQYNDWLERYYPYMQKQMDLSDNRLMTAQLNRVGPLAQQAQNGAQTGLDNQMARYGVNMPKNPQDNSRALAGTLAVAGAKNGIREAEQDRQLNILTGASSPLRQQMNIVSNNK